MVGAADRAEPGGTVQEPVPGDLAGGRARDALDLVQLLGDLEVREPLAAQGERLRRVEAAGGGDDEGDRHLAEDVVRLAGHGGVGDAGDLAQHLLHLAGVDVLPGADDEFLEPSGDGQVAGAVADREVAGVEPAVAQRLGGGVGLLVVAGHDVRAAHPHLALGAVGHVEAGTVVDDPQREARHGQAAGAFDAGAGRPVDGDGAGGLGGAVGVDEGRVEGLLGRAAQRGAEDGAAHQPDPHRGRGETRGPRGADEIAVERGNTGDDRGPVLAPQVEYVVGGVAVGDAGGGPDGRHGQHADDVGQAVEQRQRPQHPVLGGEAERGDVGGGDRPQAVALGGEDALGAAGGAGGEEHPGDVVEPLVVAGRGAGIGGGELFVGEAPGREGSVTVHHDHGQRAGSGGQPAHRGHMGGVGDDDAAAADGEQVLQLRGGQVRVDRDADAAGADDREVALHHLDPVAEEHRHPVAGQQAEAGQMSGEAAGTGLQTGVADGAPGVEVGGPVAEAPALFGEEFVDRADQLGTQHAVSILPFAEVRVPLRRLRPGPASPAPGAGDPLNDPLNSPYLWPAGPSPGRAAERRW
ncbi:hypothetical protein GCM10018772_36680 [Streptomyces fumanus]|uniref:Uncharacterized protein n=1 Tax=Streptomyces fumanus TaxID=67302 RepID=A0A919E371_9ACTN|nr:hypothetical protein GCM10018772_36680 [Streptomyces fumanus]